MRFLYVFKSFAFVSDGLMLVSEGAVSPSLHLSVCLSVYLSHRLLPSELDHHNLCVSCLVDLVDGCRSVCVVVVCLRERESERERET